MEDEQTQAVDEDKAKQKKTKEIDQNHCTTAPSAEHSRASGDDEPCDDSRGS